MRCSWLYFFLVVSTFEDQPFPDLVVVDVFLGPNQSQKVQTPKQSHLVIVIHIIILLIHDVSLVDLIDLAHKQIDGVHQFLLIFQNVALLFQGGAGGSLFEEHVVVPNCKHVLV